MYLLKIESDFWIGDLRFSAMVSERMSMLSANYILS